MKRSARLLTILFIAIAGVVSPLVGSTAADDSHLLDGSSYVVEVHKAGEEGFSNENIEFSDGKMESTFLEDRGFQNADYKSSKDGEITRWTATARGTTRGSLAWEGVVGEGGIEGTIVSDSTGAPAATWTFKSVIR